MPASYFDFVSSLVYGDLGAADLGPAPAGTRNHMQFTLNFLPSSATSTVTGSQFLAHHVDVMLARYAAWRSLGTLPPVRPWNGQDAFPDNDASTPPEGPALPVALNGGPFPAGWTVDDLGTAVRSYFNVVRHYNSPMHGGMEMADEVKAPFSYRYWAFMKWADDLRRRLLGQPVFPVGIVYDRDGTVLSEKEFADLFHQVHHVWHPNVGPPASWTQPTPGFTTSVGQHARKKQISRTQVGLEFFAFHRDHLELFDRWLARTGQAPVVSVNTCAHDTVGVSPHPDDPAWPPALNALDTVPSPDPASPYYWRDYLGPGSDAAPGIGYPLASYGATPPTVDFFHPHFSEWEGTLAEFASAGEMGQFFAQDNNPFAPIPVAGATDAGYHAIGHVINGDLIWPVANNYSPRFFAWHGFIDDLWTKRKPQFTTFVPGLSDGSAFPEPHVLTILREFSPAADTVEPANAIAGISLVTGNGTLRLRVKVRPDPFGRPLDLRLRCEVLREAAGPAPVIALPPRDLVITPGAPGGPNERQQNTDFVEDFVFDGSAGTVDGAGHGPFVSDNAAFSPTAVGFVNSLIRITGHLVCRQKPDGSTPAAAGTVASAGTAVTGTGTAFNTLFRQGDLIRASGQVRAVASVASATSLAVVDAFDPPLPGGTSYERLDGYDHLETVELPLVQEKLAPDVTVYLDRSTFSLDQVMAVAVAGTSSFDNAFYVLLQDRTARPAPIAWPPEVEPALYGLIAPPVRAAGLYPDLAHAPVVELRDAGTNALVPGLSVTVTAADPEAPGQHPSLAQRITYRCRVDFTGTTAFGTMMAGDPPRPLKLVVTATDRSGNRTVNETAGVQLEPGANPYMLDGPVSWLSTDTRVFRVNQGQARFGVAAGWSDPNTFIAQAIQNLRAGGGTAGGESFDGLPTDQTAAYLEYDTAVGGVNVYNFALAKVRLQSQTGAANVRTSFRLFRWGVANVSFDPTLAYRTAPSGIARLGRTTTNELASIPFFAAPRVPATASMDTQPDPVNVATFPAGVTGEALLFYGAYLDINQTAPRFPATFVGDGPFTGGLQPIRDLMVSHHQCMVVETVYAPDPTVPDATPGTSDNLSQRNLMIVQTANPGTPITRTVLHSFNIDVSHCARCRIPDAKDDGMQMKVPSHASHMHGGEGEGGFMREVVARPARPAPARAAMANMGAMDHGDGKAAFGAHVGGWLSEAVLGRVMESLHAERETATKWQFDLDAWKHAEGVDELVFFWNGLPHGSVAELYIPAAGVEEIVNLRNLRHAPGTVRIVDSHTLRLEVGGPAYVPVPAFWGDNLAALLRVELPYGIRAGETYTVDVLQLGAEAGRVMGGFQLNIAVGKAHHLVPGERSALELFKRRLRAAPADSRWLPVLQRELEFRRARGQGFVDLANEPGLTWDEPGPIGAGERVRIVLERIQIVNDNDPGLKGAGEFRFRARVKSDEEPGIRETRLPAHGEYHVSDRPHRNTLHLNIPIFEGAVQDRLTIEVGGIELDTFDPDDVLPAYRREFSGAPRVWMGSFGPGDEALEPEDMGDWKLWYRIERA